VLLIEYSGTKLLASRLVSREQRLLKGDFMKMCFLVAVMFAGFAPQISAQTEFVKPEGLAPANGYSHVVVTQPGRMIFLSGQVANNRQGQLVGKDDLKAQAVQVFENLKAALSGAGATFDDVVKITWYVKGYRPENLSTLRDVRNQYVNKENPPASTLVGVASLFREEYLLEVDAVATVPAKRVKKP
jgi:enamine deaminase RidA (YjgF/YER057c/UK114 family)